VRGLALAAATLTAGWLLLGPPGWPPGHAWTARWWVLAAAAPLGLLPARARTPALLVLALAGVTWSLQSPLSRLALPLAILEVGLAAGLIATVPRWCGPTRWGPVVATTLLSGLLLATGSARLATEAGLLAGAMALTGPAARHTWAPAWGLLVLAGLHYSELGAWAALACAGILPWSRPSPERPEA